MEVAIVGGTGLVGRAMAAYLIGHSTFKLGMIVGSENSVGRTFKEVWNEKETKLKEHYGCIWKILEFPEDLKDVVIKDVDDLRKSDIKFVVSCIAPSHGHIEDMLLSARKYVFSMSPYKRLDDNVSLLCIPEVNSEVLMKYNNHFIKSPNCCSCGSAITIKAIDNFYGVEEVTINTYQSLTGRGDSLYPIDYVCGNVYPIGQTKETTEQDIQREISYLFPGTKVSVSAVRVYVQTGHYISIKLKLKNKPECYRDLIEVFDHFNPNNYPYQPITIVHGPGRPRPSCDNNISDGMSVAVGGITLGDEVYDLTYSIVVNNVVRGAYGNILLNMQEFIQGLTY